MNNIKSKNRDLVDKLYKSRFDDEKIFDVMENMIRDILDETKGYHAIQSLAKTWTNHVLNRMHTVQEESHVTLTFVRNEMPFTGGSSMGNSEVCKNLMYRIVSEVYGYMVDTRSLYDDIQEAKEAGCIVGPRFDKMDLQYKLWVQRGVTLKRYAKDLDRFTKSLTERSTDLKKI